MGAVRPARPEIVMNKAEAEQLTALALRAALTSSQAANRLLDEIERAHLHDKGSTPGNVVTMNCTVDFIDGVDAATQTVQVVYPGDDQPAAGKVSVLGPVGAGLIGLRVGQSIAWPGNDGKRRLLKVLAVRPPTQTV